MYGARIVIMLGGHETGRDHSRGFLGADDTLFWIWVLPTQVCSVSKVKLHTGNLCTFSECAFIIFR